MFRYEETKGAALHCISKSFFALPRPGARHTVRSRVETPCNTKPDKRFTWEEHLDQDFQERGRCDGCR